MLHAFREATHGRMLSSHRHMEWFTEQRCAGDLLNSGVFPNAKEITESTGAFRAVLKHAGRVDRADSSVLCVCVGDGNTPRTGALVAYSTAWTVVSVDPRMIVKDYGIKRLSVRAAMIEECEFVSTGTIVVLAVHSHAKLASAVSVMRAPRVVVVSIPCCVKQTLNTPPDVEFADDGIWSPERTVRVWRDAARFG